MDSTRSSIGHHAFVQHRDPARSRALAQAGDYRMEKAGDAGQKKRPGEGERHALMLEIAFTDRFGMGEKKPRKHGQDPIGHGE